MPKAVNLLPRIPEASRPAAVLFESRLLSSFLTALLLAFAAVAASCATVALAHGVAWNQLPSDKTVTISFIYSDQTPMSYSQIKIFSPEDSLIEFQNARTDKKGMFAFVPDAPGEWRFETSDGQGHLAQGSVTIAPLAGSEEAGAAGSQAPAAPEPSMASGGSPGVHPSKVILGLSLILNAALIAFALRRPKSGASKVSEAASKTGPA